MSESHLQLLVSAGPDKDRLFVLVEGEGLWLGRNPDCRYRLTDPRVSRSQCEIRVHGSKVTLIDNQSASGTLVNGVKIKSRVLKPGDVIQAGETILRFQEVSDATTLLPGAASPRAKPGVQSADNLAALVGKRLAHYDIGAILGKGQTGVVFGAVDNKDGKPVALKIFRREFSKDKVEIQRFIRAMKTMLPLRHANLIALQGAGKSSGYCWIAMELIEGESLTQVIRRIGVAGMLDWRHAFRVAVHIGRALEYAHARHIIHRNIMPQNVMIRVTDKQTKLGDLMLSKAMEGKLAEQITRPGELIGDVNYMSPERTRHTDDLDGRADIFSLGAMVYALLTGRPPFAGSTIVETLTKIHAAEPVPPTEYQMSVPAHFQGIVLRMLAKRPAERYQTAGDLLKELERVGKFHRVEA
jgi:serine/threonine protein kinase